MDNLESIKVYLEAIVVGFVRDPSAIKVDVVRDDRGVCATVHCAEADVGIVLGREGKMANALRVVMRGFGGQINEKVSVKINDPRPELRKVGAPSSPAGQLEDLNI